MSESTALTVRQNGAVVKIEAGKTRAIWAAAGANVTDPQVANALAMIGDHYVLDPALGEVMILGSKVYITAEGYLRIADQQPSYEGYELVPMTESERKDAKVGADEFAYVAKVWRKDRRFPSVGYGVASDASISMGPMKIFKREVAQKRALHRALRMAFRAGIPDYEDTLDSIEQGQPVMERISAPSDVPPQPPKPDWNRFWAHVKGMGAEREEVHRALGVESVRDWSGSLEEAITAIERFVLARDLAVATDSSKNAAETPETALGVAEGSFEETFPARAAEVAARTPAKPIMPTMSGKGVERRPPTDAEVNAGYDSLVDRADAVNVPAEHRLLDWTRDMTAEKGRELRPKVNAAEEKLAKAAKGN